MTEAYEAGESVGMLQMATQIVSAYIATHRVPSEALPDLIRGIYRSLSGLQARSESRAGPAVSAGPSVFSDRLVCLEDGLSMKMLKRHLLTVHQMTPGEYREKWGLPPDYPMVAPDYAKVRSALAKQSGLGRKPEDRIRSVGSTNDGKGDRRRRGEA